MLHTFRSLAVALLVALLVVPVLARGQTLSRDSATMIDRVFAEFDRTDGPGCVVGVDRGDEPLFRRGYGMASLELGVPLSERSVLESGSVAKQFTAGAIVYLAVQGKISLDDPIRKYVPELHDFGAPVTIRMALNHTSGLRDFWILFWLSGIDQGQRLLTMDQALQLVYRQRELNFPPDSAYLYSGSGYLLLTEVVKRVTGKSLAQFSRETFFEPLGMRQTRWRDDWNEVVPGRATGYAPADSGGFVVQMPFMHIFGTGGLLTTVGDLLRWNVQLARPSVGEQARADEMHRRGQLSNGTAISYAAGVIVKEYRGEPEISHSGSSLGYESFLARWPRRRLSVAVMCNHGGASATTLARRVADVFIGREGAPVRPAAAAAAPEPRPEPAPAGELRGLVGTYYSTELDVEYRLTDADGQLVLEIAGREPIQLRRVAKDEYAATPLNLRLTFTRSGGEAATGYLLSGRRVNNLRFVRR